MEYDPANCDNDLPVWLDDFFYLAKAPYFDEVQVYLASHNGAYFKKAKRTLEGTKVTGWVSLKDYKNGRGWHDDKYPPIKMNKPSENSANNKN